MAIYGLVPLLICMWLLLAIDRVYEQLHAVFISYNNPVSVYYLKIIYFQQLKTTKYFQFWVCYERASDNRPEPKDRQTVGPTSGCHYLTKTFKLGQTTLTADHSPLTTFENIVASPRRLSHKNAYT